jgi:AcrR family transcriptional regulator
MMRSEILTAARTILQTGGFPALSMRTLAEAVGVRAPTLYDYFASKEDVLNALFLEAVGIAREYFRERTEGANPGTDRIIQMGIAYRQFAIENPTLFRLIFDRIDSSYVPGPEQAGAGKVLFDAVQAEVETALTLGEFAPGNSEAIAISLWGLVHGLATLQLSGFVDKCSEMSPEEILDVAICGILDGFRARPTQ